MSKKQSVELAAKWITKVVTGVRGVAETKDNLKGITEHFTSEKEQEIQEVTEQEAKEIIAEYKKIQVYHKSKNNDDLGSITSKTIRELAITLSIAIIDIYL